MTNTYPPVRVTGAPGYEDFDGVILLGPADDWPVDMAIVGFEHEGKRMCATVPFSCVTFVEVTES